MSDSELLALVDDAGVERGTLTISCLPSGSMWRTIPTLETASQAGVETSGVEVRLLEESSYRYEVHLNDDSRVIALEPQELFSPNTDELSDGRIHTRRLTGTVQVVLTTTSGARCQCEIEVRSHKLNYETEYRNMMLRLAEEGAELLQSSFAAGSFGGFNPDQEHDSKTLYQRFAFLQSLLESDGFLEAIDAIRYRPHSDHASHDELVDPTRSLKADRRLAQQLVSSPNRQPVHRPVAGMRSLPRHVTRQISDETLDTVPNRFVRFALEHWKALASKVADLLTDDVGSSRSAAAERGVREARRLEVELGHLLDIPAIAEAGRLERFPASNTVLNSRVGYREIFRSFLIGEVATSLTWDGGEDVYGAGKRDVATLYEYWVFLELMAAIEAIPGFEFDRSPLVAQTKDGMSLELVRGRTIALTAAGSRRGRRVQLELHFNRTFDRPSSWTVQMRPDCSLRIRPEGAAWDAETWVHFDAKYRVDQYSLRSAGDSADTPHSGDADALEVPELAAARAQRADLQKMHAYRDAIKRTAGAYVLYPGDDDQPPESLQQFHEILPGLGAFALRPSENGDASASTAAHLTSFLEDVIDHAAAHGTGRERASYWQDSVYASSDTNEQRFDYSSALERPPADSTVLLGFVRSEQHREWILDQSLYNLRADPERRGSVDIGSPALAADFVVLYDETGPTTLAYRTTGALYVRSRAELEASGYQPTSDGPRASSQYVCLELGDPVELPVEGDVARMLGADDGSPTVAKWDAIAAAAASNERR